MTTYKLQVIHLQIEGLPYAPCGARYKTRTRVRAYDSKRVTFANHSAQAREVSCDNCRRTAPYWRASVLQLPGVTLVRERPHETFRWCQDTDGRYRDVSTGVFHPEAGGTWPYGDWDYEATPEDATHIMVPCTGYSDYSGSGVDRSNNRALREDYPDTFTEATGGHGTSELMLSVWWRHANGDDFTAALLESIEGLSDYPLYDEEDHSMLEMEVADEAWENWLYLDVPRQLQDDSPAPEAMEDAIEALDELATRHAWESTRAGWHCDCGWQAPLPLTGMFREQALYKHVAQYPSLRDLFYETLRDQNESPYMESATDIVFPCMKESVATMAARIWEMRCKDNPQIPGWFNPGQMTLDIPGYRQCQECGMQYQNHPNVTHECEDSR